MTWSHIYQCTKNIAKIKAKTRRSAGETGHHINDNAMHSGDFHDDDNRDDGDRYIREKKRGVILYIDDQNTYSFQCEVQNCRTQILGSYCSRPKS